MTTVTQTRSPARPVPTARTTGASLGRAAVVLSIAAALATIAATTTALLFRDALRGPAVSIGSMQGTALVLLVVTVPVLVVSMALVARGVELAVIGWLGALGSITYQSVLFLFGIPFNAFFFLYVAMLSSSIWSIVMLAAHAPLARPEPTIDRPTPARMIAGWLVVNAVLFLGLWLQATVPAVLSSEPPAFLAGTGMTTGPVQIMELGFTLPLMVLAAGLLLRRRPWGWLLTGALLVMLAIETASIGVDQWIGHAADPASPVASAALTPVFALMTTLGLGVLGLFLRSGTTRESSRS